jgi:hypothetical protein
MAYTVFTQYPEVAEVAIPQFIAMLNDKELLTKGKAGMVLGSIGKPAIPALLAALSHTNDIARAIAAYHLGEIGTNAIHVRPNLETMLSDRSILVRLNAAGALGKLGGDPEIIVPVLLLCFHEGDADTRSDALEVLSKLKERAKSAVPDLIYSLAAATNSNDHYSLLRALREIDSEQAAKFEPPRPAATSEPPPEDSAPNPDQLMAPGKP